MTKVLVVDDAPEMVRLLRSLLKSQGYEVSAAESGPEALKLARAQRPDVILLDVMMPEMDGIEVCRRLKADGELCTIPVILATAKDSDGDVVKGLDAGADDYVAKPFNREILAARIRAAVRVKTSHDLIRRTNEQLQVEIADRKRAEAEAKSLRRQIEFILGATKTGLDVIDSDFNIRYVDRERQKLYGDPTGKKCYQFFAGRDEPCAGCATIRAMETKQRAVSERTLPKEDNRPVQVTSIPFCNDKGEWLYAQVNIDISERKRMERELAQAQKLESIGHLAAGIAHEINTPTQYIGDNTRFLQETFGDIDKLLVTFDRLLQASKDDTVSDDLVAEVEAAVREAEVDYLTDEIPKAIRQSLEGVDRVAKIVHSMKEFSHPGNAEMQAVDLNKTIDNTLTVSRNEWKYVADIVTDFDPNLPLVDCLPGDFNQVVLNVVVNAAQAIAGVVGDGSTGKGTITVRTRLDGDWVEIRITDTGPGIPEAIRSEVFDHFFTTKEVGKGTGQGLTIAHSIVVDKHRGKITFETEVGKGTTFIIRLPMSNQSEPKEDIRLEEPQPAR